MEFSDFLDLIAEGEHDTQDFKQGADPSKAGSIAKDIAAFANAAGGRVLFGVTNSGAAVGCAEFLVKQWQTISEDTLQDGLLGTLNPYWTQMVALTVERFEDNGKRFVLVRVPPAEALVGWRKKGNGPDVAWEYWKRHGRSNVPFPHHELLEKTELQRFREERRRAQVSFLKLVNRQLGLLCSTLSMAYGAASGVLEEIDYDRAVLLKRYGIKQVRGTAVELYDDLKGLSFLGLNLDDSVKDLMVELVGALRDVTGSLTVWSSPEEFARTVEHWKLGDRSAGHPVEQHRDTANELLRVRRLLLAYSVTS